MRLRRRFAFRAASKVSLASWALLDHLSGIMRSDKPLSARQPPRSPRREGILTDRMRAMPVVLVLFVACLIPELILSGADYGLWGDPGWRLWAWQHGGF